MSLTVRVDVNGDVVDVLKIRNEGPPSGQYAEGDGPCGEGVRTYAWSSINRGSGSVEHACTDGWSALVAKVLEDM